MRVYVYPADTWACGLFRLQWPGQLLAARGHDVRVLPFQQGARRFRLFRDHHGQAVGAQVPADADVIVFQRVCERDVVDLIRLLEARGVATVVDVDDYLSAIHPGNLAFVALHPKNVRNRSEAEPDRDVSFRYLHEACQAASLVTVTTPALVPRYAPHGRVRVLPNVLPDHYFGLPHDLDLEVLGWPASYHNHPDDPQVTHGAVARLTRDGHQFRMVGDPDGAGRAFGLDEDPPTLGPVDLLDYPRTLAAQLGVGIVPLADTAFNNAKSWLKGLELSAAGVPFVASPRAEYRRLHQLGAGLLAKDKGQDWYRQCRRLLTDRLLRRELSEAGRAVAETLRLRDHARLWWDAWTVARELRDADRRRPVPVVR